MSVRYVDGKPVRVETVVVSAQHAPDVPHERLRDEIIEHVVLPILPPQMVDRRHLTCHINPTGRFVTGGPMGDTGVTGRKIIVDTYGGSCPHGGGAFSGKDPTKVDRSAAYMARHVAKSIVAAGLAERCMVQVAYAIGVVDPVSVMVETFGTGKIAKGHLEQLIQRQFDLTPAGIIRVPRPSPPDLPEDRRVRTLRTERARVHLGTHRPRQGPPSRRGDLDASWTHGT